MKKTSYIIVVIIITMTMTFLVGCNTKKKTQKEKNISKLDGGNYNVIFITTDQERYFQDFPEGSQYEARELLQEMGTTFEKNYICSNVSSSSRSVIYTGQHITETKIHDNVDFKALQEPMSPDVKTVGQMMRDLGYYSAFKGKSHFTNVSAENKEEALIPSENTEEAQVQTKDDMEAYGFSDWNPDGDYVGGNLQGYYRDPVIKSSAISWIRSKGMKLNEDGKPFFLAVNMVNPHDIMYADPDEEGNSDRADSKHTFPITKPPKDKLYERTYDGQPLEESVMEEVDESKLPKNYSEYKKVDEASFGKAPQTEEEWTRFRDYYFNAIQDNDNNLMDLVEEIENQNLYDNTIIIFTSDHGDMMGAHQIRGKGGFMYENNIHVPLVIVHPDYEGGRKVEAVTSSLDLTPTIVDFTKASKEEKAKVMGNINGVSLVPLMKNPNIDFTKDREGALFAFSDLQMMDADGTLSMTAEGRPSYKMDLSKRGVVRGIVDGRYKFARYFAPNNFNTPFTFEEIIANNDIELYDLKKDPNEMTNLAAEPEKNKELILKMNDKLNKLITKEIGKDNGREFDTLPGAGLKGLGK